MPTFILAFIRLLFLHSALGEYAPLELFSTLQESEELTAAGAVIIIRGVHGSAGPFRQQPQCNGRPNQET